MEQLDHPAHTVEIVRAQTLAELAVPEEPPAAIAAAIEQGPWDTLGCLVGVAEGGSMRGCLVVREAHKACMPVVDAEVAVEAETIGILGDPIEEVPDQTQGSLVHYCILGRALGVVVP